MTKSRQLILITAALIVALFVGSWFLLISPKRADAQALRVKTAQAQQQVTQLNSQLALLKQEAKDLPAKEAELAKVDQAIPDQVQLPALLNQLRSLAAQNDVELVSVSPQAPTPYTAPGASSTGGSSATAGSVTTTTQPNTPLTVVPVGMQVAGKFAQVKQFLNALESLQRIYLVTGFQVAVDYSSKPAATTATIASGPLNVTITGQTYMAGSQATASGSATATSPTTTTTK